MYRYNNEEKLLPSMYFLLCGALRCQREDGPFFDFRNRVSLVEKTKGSGPVSACNAFKFRQRGTHTHTERLGEGEIREDYLERESDVLGSPDRTRGRSPSDYTARAL